MALLTRKMLKDYWNATPPEAKARCLAEMARQRAEDKAFEEQYILEHYDRLAQRVALRTRIAARSKIPTLWFENEAGDRWIYDAATNEAPPPGFIYQHSRFPNILQTNVSRMVRQEEVDACPHTNTKPDLGLVEGFEGRECLNCNGTQTKDKGTAWPEKWKAEGSRGFFVSDSSWPTDLVLAMVRPTRKELRVAIERFGDEPRLFDMNDAIVLASTSCERCLNSLLWRYGLDDGYPPFSEEWYKCNTKCSICETPGVLRWLLLLNQKVSSLNSLSVKAHR